MTMIRWCGPAVAAGLLLLAAPHAAAQVRATRGQVFRVESLDGSLRLEGSEGDVVEIVTGDSERRLRLVPDARGAIVLEGRRGQSESAATVRVPRWMAVHAGGVNLDVTARGLAGEIRIETVNGDIDVEGGRGVVVLSSVSGEVRLRGAEGTLDTRSVNGEVTLLDVAGTLHAETTNGEIAVRRARLTALEMTSVNGDLLYEGTIAGRGRYRAETHNGSIHFVLPAGVSATAAISTYRGRFESDFPTTVTGRITPPFRVVLGAGEAVLDLSSFQGDVRLERAERMPRR